MILLTNVNKIMHENIKKNIKKFAGMRYSITRKTSPILKYIIPIFTP